MSGQHLEIVSLSTRSCSTRCFGDTDYGASTSTGETTVHPFGNPAYPYEINDGASTYSCNIEGCNICSRPDNFGNFTPYPEETDEDYGASSSQSNMAESTVHPFGDLSRPYNGEINNGASSSRTDMVYNPYLLPPPAHLSSEVYGSGYDAGRLHLAMNQRQFPSRPQRAAPYETYSRRVHQRCGQRLAAEFC